MHRARTAPTPKDTIGRYGTASLYRFRRGGAASAPLSELAAPEPHAPVLLVPSLLHCWKVLDLRENASVAAALAVGAGRDTFLLDWGAPEAEDRFTSWDDLVGRLERAVRAVLRTTHARTVALVGYSMGATLCAISAARHPERVAALVNLAGPIDFAEAGRLREMVDPRWFDARAVTSAGNLPALHMRAGLSALNPLYSISKWVELLGHLHDEEACASFHALEEWAAEEVDFPAAAYATFIEELYQRNLLVRGEHRVHGEQVDLSRITCPVLTVVAESDRICPAEAATALNRAVGSKTTEVFPVQGGHVGAIVGRRAATDLYPRLVGWLHRHSRAARSSLPESRL
jgi:polyhydroxyalkanoate synthase subunit PhaC